ncbi:MAG: hypothetical protein ABFD50_23105 [Smithella sp.]
MSQVVCPVLDTGRDEAQRSIQLFTRLLMKNSTASTFTWLSLFLLFLGLIILSPSGAFLALVLSALSALIPVFTGAKKIRIAAVILLSASILLASAKYPEFQKEQKTIHGRTLKTNN